MKQLVEYIVSNLVSHPEDVSIEETKSAQDEGLSNIIIKVNQEDVGRVIGRSGKVINAIRQIARIAAIQKGVRVRVDLQDDNQAKPEIDNEAATETQPQTEQAPPQAPSLEEEEKQEN